MPFTGVSHKVGEHIDTDAIIPARFLVTTDPKKLGENCMEGLEHGWVKRVQVGDILVAERNFGCGSSREHAPIAILGAGMKAVIAAFPVRTLYSSVTSSSNGAFQRVMRAAETANLAITVPDVGDTFSLGSATVTVLGPQKHYSDVNNQSLILRVDYGSNAFLFTGDAEYESETDVLDAGEDVRCDVIKAGHHGSRTSTGYRLLYEAQPKYAVISCGADNEYGHPHDDTLSRLRDADVTVYRTDLNGTIVCRSDGVDLTFTTEKEG